MDLHGLGWPEGGEPQIPETDGRSESHAKPTQKHDLGWFLVSGKGGPLPGRQTVDFS